MPDEQFWSRGALPAASGRELSAVLGSGTPDVQLPDAKKRPTASDAGESKRVGLFMISRDPAARARSELTFELAAGTDLRS